MTLHTLHCSLEMLDKYEVPLIPDGYPLVVALNALLDAVKSVSLIVNGSDNSSAKLRRKQPPPPSSMQGNGVEGVMLRSSWSGVLAALALLLDAWQVTIRNYQGLRNR